MTFILRKDNKVTRKLVYLSILTILLLVAPGFSFRATQPPLQASKNKETSSTQQSSISNLRKQNLDKEQNKLENNNIGNFTLVDQENQKEKLQLGPIPPIIFPTGSIFLDETENIPYQEIDDESIAPKLGGWQKLDIQKPQGVTKQIDQMIKLKFPTVLDQKNVKLISAQKQVVYGWNYHFVYEQKQEVKNDNGTTHQVTNTYDFYCYQDPDQETNQAQVQTFSRKTVTTDQSNQVIAQSDIILSDDDLTQSNILKRDQKIKLGDEKFIDNFMEQRIRMDQQMIQAMQKLFQNQQQETKQQKTKQQQKSQENTEKQQQN